MLDIQEDLILYYDFSNSIYTDTLDVNKLIENCCRIYWDLSDNYLVIVTDAPSLHFTQ